MRVITFSKYFPAKHPKRGQPTFFPEKIMAGLADVVEEFKIPDHFTDWEWYEYYNAVPKFHTIRAGSRWKVGDWFSPRIWSGKPYASKQIEFAPPIQVKKVFNFTRTWGGFMSVNSTNFLPIETAERLVRNDGLEWRDFQDWFECQTKKGEWFSGQIICWNDKIDYCSTKKPAVQECDASKADSSNVDGNTITPNNSGDSIQQ